MNVVLFVMLPYVSHFFPTFGLASKLRNEGKKIVFCGNDELKNLIINEGFEYIPLNYLEEYRLKSLKRGFAFMLKTLFEKSFLISRFKEFLKFKYELENILETLKPNVIYLDEYIAEYYFVLKKFNLEVVILNTRLSTLRKKGVPPQDSLFIPDKSLNSDVYCEVLWKIHFCKLFCEDLLARFSFLGKDEKYFWERLCKQNGWNYDKVISTNHSFNKSISEIHTINLAPEHLEFFGNVTDKKESYFHSEIKRDESKYFDEEYFKLLKEVEIFKRKENTKIVYSSFGTLSESNERKVNSFYIDLISVVKDINNIFLVISSGSVFIKDPQLENVRIFKFIPQIDFLPHTDLMINHAGIGSIKECLDKNVSMIVVPLNKKVDQKGCAARVVSNRLGRLINIDSYSKKDILQALMSYVK